MLLYFTYMFSVELQNIVLNFFFLKQISKIEFHTMWTFWLSRPYNTVLYKN